MCLGWNGDEVARNFKVLAINEGLRRAEETIGRDVAATRCPVHHESPNVVTITTVGNRVVTTVSACCDEMRTKTQKVAADQA